MKTKTEAARLRHREHVIGCGQCANSRGALPRMCPTGVDLFLAASDATREAAMYCDKHQRRTEEL